MSDKTDTAALRHENPAETMRDVMADLMHHTIVDADPEWNPSAADLITVPEKRKVGDVST